VRRYQPIPRQEDRRTQAIVDAHFQSANEERAVHDSERRILKDSDGNTEVVIQNSGSLQLFHHFGREAVGWRVVDNDTGNAGSLKRSAKDTTSITIENTDASNNFRGTIEVW